MQKRSLLVFLLFMGVFGIIYILIDNANFIGYSIFGFPPNLENNENNKELIKIGENNKVLPLKNFFQENKQILNKIIPSKEIKKSSSGGSGGGSPITGYSVTPCTDLDNDGYGDVNGIYGIPNGCTYDLPDCNDNNTGINPGVTEICGNGIDEDCDGSDLICPIPNSIYVDINLTSDCLTNNYNIATRTCSGTDGIAFNTIQEGVNNATAGATVYIRGGVYYPASPIFIRDKIGTANAKITFKNYNSEEVIIDGTNTIDISGAYVVIYSVDSTYLVFDGITIRNSRQYGIIAFHSDHIEIRNSKVHSNGYFGVYFRGTSYGLIDHNEIFDNNLGIRLGAYDNPPYYRPEYNNISNNLVYNSVRGNTEGSDAITLGGFANYNIIKNNVVFNNYDDGIDSSAEGGSITGSNFNIIEDNIVFHSGYDPTGLGDGNGIKVSTNAGGGHIIRYNIVFDNERGGFDQDKELGYPQNWFYNNIAYNDGISGFIIDVPLAQQNPPDDAVLYNNIAANHPNGLDIAVTTPTSVNTSNYNFWADGRFISGQDANSLSGDPKFNNPTLTIDTNFQASWTIQQKLDYIRNQVKDKFSLQSNSTAIDAGTIIPGYHCSTSGPHPGENCREWYGTAPDMGAFEYVSNITSEMCNNGIDDDGDIAMDIEDSDCYARGKIYYIDSQNGNDSWSGYYSIIVNGDGPWKTFAKAQTLITSQTIKAGDKVLFRRGQTFGAGGSFGTFNGTNSNPITIGAYGAGARPEINEVNISVDWPIFYFSAMPNGSAVVLDGLYIHRLNWTSYPAIFSFYWAANTYPNITIRNSEIEGGYDAMTIQSFCSSFTLDNVTVHGAQRQGLMIGCGNLTIRNSNFYNNGQSTFDHNVYISHGENVLIEGNKFHDSISCFMTHGTANNMIFRNNDIYHCNFGLTIDPGYSSYEEFRNILIENNFIHDHYGVGWPVNLASCVNCSFINNIVYNNSNNNNEALFIGGVSSIDANTSNIYIYHNTFYNNRINVASNASNVNVMNNLFYDTRPSSTLFYQYPSTQYANLSNNFYYLTQNPSRAIYTLGSSSYNFSQYNEKGAIFGQDPLLVNLNNIVGNDNIFGTDDDGFMIQTTSPAKDVGQTLIQVAKDIRGVSRPQGAGWDIGAYEYTGIITETTTTTSTSTSTTLPASTTTSSSTTSSTTLSPVGETTTTSSTTSTSTSLAPISTSTSLSTGGSGGGRRLTLIKKPCTENWTCFNWLECKLLTKDETEIYNQQRECYDRNNCDTNLLKPITERDCIQEEQSLPRPQEPKTGTEGTKEVIGTEGSYVQEEITRPMPKQETLTSKLKRLSESRTVILISMFITLIISFIAYYSATKLKKQQ